MPIAYAPPDPGFAAQWEHAESLSESSSISTSFTEKVRLTFTPNEVGDWLIIITFQARHTNTGDSFEILGELDDTYTICSPNQEPEINDPTLEYRTFGHFRVFQDLSTSEHHVDVDYRTQDSGTTMYIKNVRIVAIQIEDIDNVKNAYAEYENQVSNPGSGFTDYAEATITPTDDNKKYLVIGCAEVQPSTGTSFYSEARISVDDTSYYPEEAPTGVYFKSTTRDLKDWFPLMTSVVVTLSSGSHTVAYQLKGASYSDFRRIRIFVMRLDDVYEYEYVSNPTENSQTGTTWKDASTLEFTSSAADYLILATLCGRLGTSGESFQNRFTIDGVSEIDHHNEEQSDASYRSFQYAGMKTLSAESQTFKTQFRACCPHTAYVKESVIVAIKRPEKPVVKYYLTVISPYGTPGGEGWYDNCTTAYATLNTGVVDHGNGTRRIFINWTGDASGTNYLESNPIHMDQNKTAIANWKTQYQVTFNQTGLDNTATGTVVTVDDLEKSFGELPFSEWFDSGALISYSYTSTVPSSDTDKRFDLVSVTGPTSSFTVTEPVTITGNYKTQYYLAMSTNFGTVTPGSGWHDAGSTVQISASAPNVVDGERYVWLGWTGTGAGSCSSTDNPASITMNGPINETAAWRHEHYLTVTSPYDSPIPTSGWFEAETSITASVTSPVSGPAGTQYVCTGWDGTGSVPTSGTTTSVSFVINEPSSITWNWETQYYLTVISPYGTPGGMGWYDSGDTAHATLDTGVVDHGNGTRRMFTHWSGDASGTDYAQSDSITMDASKTATANWKTQYYLTVQIDPPGITTIPGEGWYNYSETVELTAPAVAGYDFLNWDVDGDPVSGNPIQVHVNETHTATAHYEPAAPPQYLITFNQSGVDTDYTGVVLTVDGNDYGVADLPVFFWWEEGSTHDFAFQSPLVVTPEAKRYVWTSTTGLSSLQSDTITVTTDGSIVGNYKTQYHLTVRTAPSGIVTIPGEGWYDDLTSVPLTAPSVAGYNFLNWDVDGTSQGAGVVSITVSMIEPHTATAHYNAVAVPVGGYSVSLTQRTEITPLIGYTMILAIFGAALTLFRRKRK